MSTVSDKPKIENPTQVRLVDVRLSYPALFRPKAVTGDSSGTPKFSATFLLDKKKNAADIAAVKKVIDILLAEKMKGKKLPPDKVCLRDGSMKPDIDGYDENMMFVTSSNTRKPQVVDSNRAGRSPLSEDDSRIFGGIYVNAVISLWFQDNEFGKRINASLDAVQYSRPGEPFGAAPVDTDAAFGDLPDSDENDGVL